MGKTITEQTKTGIVTYKPTRKQRRSQQKLIPLTPAPKTVWQKFVRSAVG